MIQAADGGVMMWGIFSWHTKRQSKTAYEDYRCQHKLIRSSRWADCKLLIRTSTAEKTGLYTSTITLLINPFLSRVSLFLWAASFEICCFQCHPCQFASSTIPARVFHIKSTTLNVKHLQEVLCWKTETQTADESVRPTCDVTQLVWLDGRRHLAFWHQKRP